jgi:hypothetical protein
MYIYIYIYIYVEREREEREIDIDIEIDRFRYCSFRCFLAVSIAAIAKLTKFTLPLSVPFLSSSLYASRTARTLTSATSLTAT